MPGEVKARRFVETEWGVRVDLVDQALDPQKFPSRVQRVLDLCRERGKTRILVDARGSQRNVSLVALLEGVESTSRMQRAFRIALVAPHLIDNEDSRLVSDAAYTRGVYVRYFPDEDAAMAWLLEGY